jgi:hypothetical protein
MSEPETNTIAVTVGPLLFEFASHAQWVNKASSWFRSYRVTGSDTICVDAKGRICRIGKQFMRAEKEQTYPIRVFEFVVE